MSGKKIEQAAQWFAELQGRDGSDLSPPDLLRWERWIADPGNRQTFDRLSALWGELDTLPRSSQVSDAELHVAREYDGSVPVAQWLASQARRPNRFSPRTWALAASVAVVVLAGAFYGTPSLVGNRAETFVTGVAEHKEVPLSDGSTVTLGASTELAVRYDDVSRNVELLEGEALFTVARAPGRPFVVKAGAASIRALGTAFNVLRTEERLVVTVTQGLVEVKAADAASPTRLERGKQASYSPQKPAGVVVEADPVEAVSWREGRLRYRAESLASVIEDVNRYSSRRIILDPEVAQLEFTGVVFRDDIAQWTQSLARIFQVELVDVDAQTVLIRARTQH